MELLLAFIPTLVLLVLFSAFFSSVEIAFTALNRLRLEKLAEEGKPTAKRALKIADDYPTALSTLLIGNNIVNTAASAISTAIALSVFGEEREALAGFVATAVMTVIILIFGEICPKIIGKTASIPLARATAYPLTFFIIVFRPITWIIGGFVSLIAKLWRKKKKSDADEGVVTEEELSTIIETVEEEGVIDEDKGELLQSALDFSDITVEEILTPRIDVVGVDLDDDVKDIFAELTQTNFSRFPVYHDSIDHIEGVFYLTNFMKDAAERGIENVPISDYVKETVFVHKTTKLPDALAKMRENQLHMIVVLDEYGGTLGVVTMDDILEEIVGEIWDETDEIEEEIVETGNNTYEVLGSANIEDFFDEIDFDYHDFESSYTTMGGWAVEMLNEDVHEGDSFTYKNLYVEITEMGTNIVEKLTVLVKEPSEEDDENEESEQ